jgi:hypothetical protein
MTAQIAERTLLEPYCTDCKVSADPTTRLAAEAWAAKHDADYHPEPEGEDG